MAINKKLIHFNTKENFDLALEGNLPSAGEANADHGQIHDYSIVFVKDSKEIGTHGNLYKSVNWSIIGDVAQPVYVYANKLDIQNNITPYPEEYAKDINSIKSLKIAPNDSSFIINNDSALVFFVRVNEQLTTVPTRMEYAFNYQQPPIEDNVLDLTSLIEVFSTETTVLGACLCKIIDTEFVPIDTVQYFIFK